MKIPSNIAAQLLVKDRLLLQHWQEQLIHLTSGSFYLAVLGTDSTQLADDLQQWVLDGLPGAEVRIQSTPALEYADAALRLFNLVAAADDAAGHFLEQLTLQRDQLVAEQAQLIIFLNETLYNRFLGIADLRNFVQFHNFFRDQLQRSRENVQPLTGSEKHRAYHATFNQLQAEVQGGEISREDLLHLIMYVVRLGIEIGDYEVQEALIIEAMIIAVDLDEWEKVAALHNSLGRVYQFTHRTEEAKAQFEQALKVDREHGFTQGEVVVLFNLGLLSMDRKQYAEAATYLTDGLQKCAPDRITQRMRFMAELAKAAAHQKQTETALNWMKQVRVLQDPLPVEIHLGFGDTLETLGFYEEAIASFESLLKWIRSIGNESIESIICARMGELYRKTDEYQLAKVHLTRAVSLQEKWELPLRRAGTLSNLALVLLREGEEEQAIQYLEETLEIYRNAGRKRDQARILGNIGAIYHERGDWRKSYDYYQEAYQLDLETNWDIGKSFRLGNLAMLCIQSGDFEAAEEFLEEGRQWDKTIKNQAGLMMKTHYQAMLHLARGEAEAAIQAATDSLQYYEQTGALGEQAYVLRTLAAAYRLNEEEQLAVRAERRAAGIEAGI